MLRAIASSNWMLEWDAILKFNFRGNFRLPVVENNLLPHYFFVNMKLGVQKPCSEAEFQQETEDLLSKCVLKDVGTFYFTFGGLSKGHTNMYDVFLKFYDSEEKVMHTSSSKAFSAMRREFTTVAINTCTFLLGEKLTWKFVMLNKDWTSSKLILATLGNSELANLLYPSKLRKVRHGTPGDFDLKSNQGDLIEVHKAVVAPLWPFFEAALNSEMKESQEDVLELQCPTSTLETIVRHLYDEDLELQFEDAANLVVVAQMYDLPELLITAISFIKSRKNTFDELLTAWEKGQEAKNEAVKSFCAKNMIDELVASKDKLAKLPKDHLLDLLMDVAKLSETTESKKD